MINGEWKCASCTVVNEDESSTECMLCQQPRNVAPITGKKVGKQSGRCKKSVIALGNMSFAAWEMDRKEWTCGACTFVNDLRYLVCKGCGLVEGAESKKLCDSLSHMTLEEGQACIVGNFEKASNKKHEEVLRKERIVELIEDQEEEQESQRRSSASRISDYSEEGGASAPSTAEWEKARRQVNTLEGIQSAEKEEHDNMRRTLEQWRRDLDDNPNPGEEQKLQDQQDTFDGLVMEWKEKQWQIVQMQERVWHG